MPIPTALPSGFPARLEHLVDVDAHEGPVYVPDEDALYFTTVPRPGVRVDIKRLDLGSLTVSVLRADASAANGMALGQDGRLVVCEQIGGAIAAVDLSAGARELLVDGFNSPNDVVVKSDGTIWFTDPSYGWLQGFRPRPLLRDAVWRYDPRTGSAIAVADSFDKPNGLCFSPERAHAVRGRQRQAAPPQGLRRPGRRAARRRARDPRELAGASGRPEGRLGGTAVRDLRGRRRGAESGWCAARRNRAIRRRQLLLRRPRTDVLFITADTAIYAAQPEAKGL